MIYDILHQWAREHGIPSDAILELRKRLADKATCISTSNTKLSEAAVQSRVRLRAGQAGAVLWRNNVGAGKLETGGFIRFGLANESSDLNEVFKSSDLIGIKPRAITEDDVGATIGQFYAREVKPAGWQYSGTKHEAAQLAFLDYVTAMGGDAKFANCEFDV